MSGYGMFEAAETDGFEEQNHRREAQKKLAGAMYAARQQFGDFLGGAKDRSDFDVRLALVKKELRECVEANGVMPVTGVMNKVVKSMKPDFRAREAAQKEAARKARTAAKKTAWYGEDYDTDDFSEEFQRPEESPWGQWQGWDTDYSAEYEAYYKGDWSIISSGDEYVLKNRSMPEFWLKFPTSDAAMAWAEGNKSAAVEKKADDQSADDKKPEKSLDDMTLEELIEWDRRDEWHNAKRKQAADWSKVDYGFEAENQTWKARDTNGNHLIVQQWLENKPTWGVENSSGFSLNGGTADSVEEAKRKAEEASERLTFGASKKQAAPEGEYHPQNDWPGYLDSTSPQSEPAADKHLIKTEEGLEHEDADNHRNFTTSKNLMAQMQEAFGEKSASEDLYVQMRAAFGEG